MFIMTDDECRYLAMCAPRDECAELASFSLASHTPPSNWNGDRNSSTLVTYARRTDVPDAFTWKMEMFTPCKLFTLCLPSFAFI
jgi:hypothetical protein